MKRLIYLLAVFSSVVACCSLVNGQGTVNFAKVGADVMAPVSDNHGVGLGPGFLAQLQLADGTNVGDPAPLLANGWYSGGIRPVPGVPGGSMADLQVAIFNSAETFVGLSNVFTVRLGGGGMPPAPPAPLLGLQPTTVFPSGFFVENHTVCDAPYCWAYDVESAAAGVECTLGGGILARVRVDPCFCGGIPTPERFRELGYRVTEQGAVEISWIKHAGFSLFGVSDLKAKSEGPASEIEPHGGYRDGRVYVRFDSGQALRFFWLGKRIGRCD